MCSGGYGLAGILKRSMPRRKPSFLKRHPECRHKPSNVHKKVKVKFTPRKDQKLIYYSESSRYPTGLHHKILYTVLTLIGIPLMVVGAILVFEDEVGLLIFPGFILFVWSAALCYMAYAHWHKEPPPYRDPKDPVEIETW